MTLSIPRSVVSMLAAAALAPAPAAFAQNPAAGFPNKPVTLLATTPNMLVVHNDVPTKTLAEFIALGRKEGKMTFASAGSGTSIHVSGELFKTVTGIDMTHIPYKGRATAMSKKLAEIGLEVVGSTPEELAAYQRAEITKWAKVVKDSGAKVE